MNLKLLIRLKNLKLNYKHFYKNQIMRKILLTLTIATFTLIAFNSCKNDRADRSAALAVNEISQPEFTEIEAESFGYSIGDEATDFNLKDVNGEMVSLSNYPEAKGFIVIFTCNTCPYAVASEERMVALDKEFKSKGYPVIAINPNTTRFYSAWNLIQLVRISCPNSSS